MIRCSLKKAAPFFFYLFAFLSFYLFTFLPFYLFTLLLFSLFLPPGGRTLFGMEPGWGRCVGFMGNARAKPLLEN